MSSDLWYTWIPLLFTALLLLSLVAAVVLLVASLRGSARRDAPARLALGVYSLLFGAALLTATALTFGTGGLTSNDLAAFPDLWSVGTLLLGLILIAGSLAAGRLSVWKAVVRPLLLALLGAVLVGLVMVVRGPDDWRAIPLGADVVVVAIVLGVLVYGLSRRAAGRDQA